MIALELTFRHVCALQIWKLFLSHGQNTECVCVCVCVCVSMGVNMCVCEPGD